MSPPDAPEAPLRILWVLSKLERDWRGGIGRVTSAGARALAARGHEVHLAGRAPDGRPGALEGVRLHAWPPARLKLAQLPRLVALGRRLRPDVVHFHSALPHGAVILPFAALRGRRARPALVATPHTGARGDYPKRLSRLALRAVDAVVAPSRWSAERAVAAGAPPERVHVVWNGVDRVVEAPEAEREPLVLCLARLVPSKGADVLLEAFDRAARARAGWRLVVGGEGRELERLRRRAAELATAERIRLPGHVAGEAKEGLLRTAAIGVVPSREDMIPGAMLELQAHGVPTVASAVGAVPEGADGGRAARLVPPGDADALASALGALMDAPELRAALGAGALRVSHARLWPALAAQVEAIYRSVLASRGA